MILIGNGYAQQRGGWYAATGPSTDVFEWLLSLTCYSCSCLLSADQHLLWKQVVSELLAPKKGSVRTSGITLLFSKIRPAPYSFLYLSCPFFCFHLACPWILWEKALRECFFFCLMMSRDTLIICCDCEFQSFETLIASILLLKYGHLWESELFFQLRFPLKLTCLSILM